MGSRRRGQGVVTIEFLFLFPVIVGILYAAAYYSILFSWQYQMQSIVDASAANGMYLDRSNPSLVDADAVRARAQQTLDVLKLELPARIVDSFDSDDPQCGVRTVSGSIELEIVRCELVLPKSAIEQAMPTLSFGFLGRFPPAPDDGIRAVAQMAF